MPKEPWYISGEKEEEESHWAKTEIFTHGMESEDRIKTLNMNTSIHNTFERLKKWGIAVSALSMFGLYGLMVLIIVDSMTVTFFTLMLYVPIAIGLLKLFDFIGYRVTRRKWNEYIDFLESKGLDKETVEFLRKKA